MSEENKEELMAIVDSWNLDYNFLLTTSELYSLVNRIIDAGFIRKNGWILDAGNKS